MNTIDSIYRFDPEKPSAKPPPPDEEAARRVLEDGNRLFSQWMESCRTRAPSRGEPRYIAARAAFGLRQEVGRTGRREVEVFYGVHDIRNHQVCMPVDLAAPRRDEKVRLASAPSSPKEFHAPAVPMARILRRDDPSLAPKPVAPAEAADAPGEVVG